VNIEIRNKTKEERHSSMLISKHAIRKITCPTLSKHHKEVWVQRSKCLRVRLECSLQNPIHCCIVIIIPLSPFLLVSAKPQKRTDPEIDSVLI